MAVSATQLTAGGTTTDGNSFTTASITPTANRLITVVIGLQGSTGTPALSVSGCGLTWVQVDNNPLASSTRATAIFRAMGASPTTGALTISTTNNVTNIFWGVAEWTGMDTSGTNGSGAIGVTGNNTVSAATSISQAWSPTAGSAGLAVLDIAVQVNPSAGTGWTALSQQNQPTQANGFLSMWSSTAASPIAASWVGSGNGFYTWIEVKPAAAVNLAGPAATAAAAAPAGSFGLALDGPVATAAAAAPAGSVSAGAVLAGEVATVAALAPTGAFRVIPPSHVQDEATLAGDGIGQALLSSVGGPLIYLRDEFGVVRNDLWFYGSPITLDGSLRLTSRSDYASSVFSAVFMPLLGTTVTGELITAATAAGQQTYMIIGKDTSNRIVWATNGNAGAGYLELVAQRRTAAVTTTIFAVPYDPVAHRWLRMVVTLAGAVTWLTSPDGETWTQQASWAAVDFLAPFCQVEVGSGHYIGAASPGADDAAQVWGSIEVLGPDTGAGEVEAPLTFDGSSYGVLSGNGAGTASIHTT